MWDYLGTFLLALVGGGIGSTVVGIYAANRTAKTAEADRALREKEFERRVELEEREYADRERDRLSTFAAKRLDTYERVRALSRVVHGHHRDASEFLQASEFDQHEQGRLLLAYQPVLTQLPDLMYDLAHVHDSNVRDALDAACIWLGMGINADDARVREYCYERSGFAIAALERRLGDAMIAAEKGENPPALDPKRALASDIPRSGHMSVPPEDPAANIEQRNKLP